MDTDDFEDWREYDSEDYSSSDEEEIYWSTVWPYERLKVKDPINMDYSSWFGSESWVGDVNLKSCFGIAPVLDEAFYRLVTENQRPIGPPYTCAKKQLKRRQDSWDQLDFAEYKRRVMKLYYHEDEDLARACKK